MNNQKNIIIKTGKYLAVLIIVLASLFIVLNIIIAEDIKVGGSCGVYNKDWGYYNPTDCGWCLGKLVKEKEDQGFIHYKCVGIKFEQMYE